MAIRHQQQDEKHPYLSPTTPGLYVTFRAYIIELICLNVNKKIGTRFWSDPKYWGPKFRREVKGVANVLKILDETEVLNRTAFIQIVKEHNIKSLLHKSVVSRVVKYTTIRIADLKRQRAKLRVKPSQDEIDIKKNSTFVDTGNKSTLAKIRESENGQKET